MNRYKSEYEHTYNEGVVNKSVTISVVAWDLVTENEVEPFSRFINDLIIEALQDGNFWKKRELAVINKAKENLEKRGVKIRIVRDDEDTEGKMGVL